ncbi:MAG: DUF2231 domain-containing protein, partial [Actinomycetes bacterium]
AGMFDEFGGLPLHPLVIHVVVLAIPLTTVLAFAFLVSRLRAWTRWVLALVAVGALGATLVAKESGEALQAALGITPDLQPIGPLIERHETLANQLVWLVAAVAVLGVLASVLVGRGRGERTGVRRGLDVALPIALVVVSAVASFWAYRVGDLGARAVWNADGSRNYQVEG